MEVVALVSGCCILLGRVVEHHWSSSIPLILHALAPCIFPHKRIHKATWISPNHVMQKQIDHICISRKFRRSWQDVWVMRGADVSSDHHLLMTTVRLCLKRFTTANSTWTKYNAGLLRDKDTQAAFQISLSNRFQLLQELIEDNETDIETQWEHCKKLWHDTSEEVLGKKTKHKEWISADTIHKLETRRERKTVLNNSRTRAAKARAQEEYRNFRTISRDFFPQLWILRLKQRMRLIYGFFQYKEHHTLVCS